MTNRNTVSIEPFAEGEYADRYADLRLYHVAATSEDDEFYIRCADLEAAAGVVVQRASEKNLPVVWRPIVEVRRG